MATLTSRRERRAAWRAVRAFLPGSARAIRREAFDAGWAAADRGENFTDAYHAVFERLQASAPTHAARTAQWRAMWTDPKAAFLARP